jgi:DNA-binding SARP family transcriptional activator
VESRVEARLQLGRHQELVEELIALTIKHPLREPLHGQLMLALYRSGRQAEALEVLLRASDLAHGRVVDGGAGLGVKQPRPVGSGGAVVGVVSR